MILWQLCHTISSTRKGLQWNRVLLLWFWKFLCGCELQESEEKVQVSCVWQTAQSGIWSFRVVVAPPASCTGELAENWLNSTSTSPGRWSGKGQSPLSFTTRLLQFPDAKWTGMGFAIICCWYRPATNYCLEEQAGIGKSTSEA